MKFSTKAACLSAFLFPGSGHFFLKCYIRGFIFALIAGVGLYLFMEAAFVIAWEIANDIENGKVAMNVEAIRALIQQALGIYQEPELINAKIAMIASWVVSSADSWRVGHYLDKKQTEVG